jgi:glucokinase
MKVLAADIGGTKTLMQIASVSDDGFKVIAEQSYPSAEYAEFSDVVTMFLKQQVSHAGDILSACFGVAGPISGNPDHQTAKVTNLAWRLDTRQLAGVIGIDQVYLINDFQAVGYGIETLADTDLHTLQTGMPRQHAPCIILGAGTGLGVAQLIWQRDHYTVVATEGGHIDFAPATVHQVGLLEYLMQRYEHVSYERLLSGPGLVNIYEYLCQSGKENPSLRVMMQNTDPAAAITRFADEHNDALANEALDLFIQIYGAMAGNLALINLSFGGVYVAGGIAPRMIGRLGSGKFIHNFVRKGRMTPLLESMPVHVVMNPKIGVRGAGRAAYLSQGVTG